MKHDNNTTLIYLGLAIKPPTDLIIEILEIRQQGELMDFLVYNNVEFIEV